MNSNLFDWSCNLDYVMKRWWSREIEMCFFEQIKAHQYVSGAANRGYAGLKFQYETATYSFAYIISSTLY